MRLTLLQFLLLFVLFITFTFFTQILNSLLLDNVYSIVVRLNLLETALDSIRNVGFGIRCFWLLLLFQGSYVHNLYLELIFIYGFLGFVYISSFLHFHCFE